MYLVFVLGVLVRVCVRCTEHLCSQVGLLRNYNAYTSNSNKPQFTYIFLFICRLIVLLQVRSVCVVIINIHKSIQSCTFQDLDLNFILSQTPRKIFSASKQLCNFKYIHIFSFLFCISTVSNWSSIRMQKHVIKGARDCTKNKKEKLT